MNPIIILLVVIALVVGVVAGYFLHRYQAEKATKNQQDKADNILRVASEQARLIESQARENAVKIIQAAETEIKERRIELNKETDRLDKRRTELDGRVGPARTARTDDQQAPVAGGQARQRDRQTARGSGEETRADRPDVAGRSQEGVVCRGRKRRRAATWRASSARSKRRRVRKARSAPAS